MDILQNNLRQIIKDKGLKQNYLAEKSNISVQALSNCINGRHDISLKIALKIAITLDMNIHDIWYLSKDKNN